MRCWYGYLCGAKYRLFANASADGMQFQHLINACLIKIQHNFTFVVPAYQVVLEKMPVNWCLFVILASCCIFWSLRYVTFSYFSSFSFCSSFSTFPSEQNNFVNSRLEVDLNFLEITDMILRQCHFSSNLGVCYCTIEYLPLLQYSRNGQNGSA